MNENERNNVIAKNEDNALNSYLDNRDQKELDCPCESCEKKEATVEFNNKMFCQDCYEDGCEQAEMMNEDR